MEYATDATSAAGDAPSPMAAAARGETIAAMNGLSASAVPLFDSTPAGPQAEAPSGVPHLWAQIGGTEWLVPLTGLRTVLAELPRVVPLPEAPEWLLGVFPYRAQLLALVDPAPVLGSAPSTGTSGDQAPHPASDDLTDLGRCAVIAGAGERSLAWRLERVSGVVHLPPSAMRGEGGEGGEGGAALGHSDARRFSIGWAALVAYGDSSARLPVLDVDRLLAALLEGLAEEDDGE